MRSTLPSYTGFPGFKSPPLKLTTLSEGFSDFPQSSQVSSEIVAYLNRFFPHSFRFIIPLPIIRLYTF
jgi:hypothetical protein